MLSDVDEKTYEFGMLRALGFNTKNIMTVIITQAFTFSIPGLVTGLIVAYGLNYALRAVLYSIAHNESTYGLSSASILIGVSLGILLPLVSNIIPIQRALGKTLRTSLDLYHRSAGQLLVSIKSLQAYGLSVNQLILSIMLVVLGVLTYYMAPSAFLFQNYELFFEILNSVLLLMIMGMTFLSILLLPYVQRFFINSFLFCFRRDRKLKQIILKNLQSHERRNTKTAIMFAITLSFLIFAGSTFVLLGHLMISQLETSMGADLYGMTLDSKHLTTIIDDGGISEFLAV